MNNMTDRFNFLVPVAMVVLVATLASPVAKAENNGWYVRANVGLVQTGDDSSVLLDEGMGSQGVDASFDTCFGSGIAVGRWLNERWRIDADWSYRSSDIDELRLDDGRVVTDGNYASSTFSVNAMYHFRDGAAVGQFSPYVGLGLAYVTEIDIDLEGDGIGPNPIEDLEDSGVALQLMGGVSYRQSDRFRWDAELRWLSFGEASLEGDDGQSLTDIDYNPLGVFVGFSYDF